MMVPIGLLKNGLDLTLKIMEYLIIAALQLIGILLHVLQKVAELDKKFIDDTFWSVLVTFWKQDRTTVMISVVVMFLNLLVHFIIDDYTDLPETTKHYYLYAFGAALLLGYAGQRLIYKYLGKAEDFMNRKVEHKLQ